MWLKRKVGRSRIPIIAFETNYERKSDSPLATSKKFCDAMLSLGITSVDDVSFIDEGDVRILGSKIHAASNKAEALIVESWSKALPHVQEWLRDRCTVVIFDNHWDIGAIVLGGDFASDNLDIIYKLIGPDFYCTTRDVENGIIFDKEEYACLLRIW